MKELSESKILKNLNSRISCWSRRFDFKIEEKNIDNKEVIKKLRKRMRGGLRKKLGKAYSPWKYLPYTVQDLKRHLENQFSEGMTWDRMEEIHIDHIKPVSMFNFSSFSDSTFLKCYALSNLQPMWKWDNIRKKNHWINPNLNPTFPEF